MSELAGALEPELALGVRLRAFCCIARQRSRCCSGSRTTGGADRADHGGLLEAEDFAGLEERTAAPSDVAPTILAVLIGCVSAAG